MNTYEMEDALETSGYNLNELWLQALERAGVDNWEGYDDAQREYKALIKSAYKDLTE